MIRKEFRVTGFELVGKYFVISVSDREATRRVRVHRNNMPKADSVGTGQLTRFSRPVPIRDGFEGRRPHIVDGSFEQQDGGDVSGQISIVFASADANTDGEDSDALLRPT